MCDEGKKTPLDSSVQIGAASSSSLRPSPPNASSLISAFSRMFSLALKPHLRIDWNSRTSTLHSLNNVVDI